MRSVPAAPFSRRTQHVAMVVPGSTGSLCQVPMIMSESHDGVLKESDGQVSTTQIGHLFGLNSGTGAPIYLSDVGNQMYAFTGAQRVVVPR